MKNNEDITVAVLCNILGRGDTYDEWSTSFVIALSKMKEIIKIHVITPTKKRSIVQPYKLPDKCINHEVLDYNHPLSMIKAVNLVSELKCDLVVVVSGGRKGLAESSTGNEYQKEIDDLKLEFRT